MAKDGNVTGVYTGDRTYSGRCNFTGGVLGMGVQVVKGSQIWYVDKNTGLTASGDGLSWDTAFLTVTEAVAAAGDYDIIFIGDGIYDGDETYPLAITQTGLKIFGSGTSGYNWGPCALKSTANAETIMTIDANGVEIAGVDFNLYTDAKSGILLGTTKSIYKTHIHDCFFGCASAGNAEGECGIAIGCTVAGAQGTYDAVDTHVERCGFHYLATAGIAAYGTRTKITNCFFISNSTCIKFLAEGANRAYHMCVDNYMIGRGGAGPGIFIASTEPTAGCLLIANNVVTNFATNITTGKSEAGIVNNQTYASASSYLQVDSS